LNVVHLALSGKDDPQKDRIHDQKRATDDPNREQNVVIHVSSSATYKIDDRVVVRLRAMYRDHHLHKCCCVLRVLLEQVGLDAY
jgi:hypothetical protein